MTDIVCDNHGEVTAFEIINGATSIALLCPYCYADFLTKDSSQLDYGFPDGIKILKNYL